MLALFVCLCANQVGSGWLNPTEEAVWPLAETLAVAKLAFQGLDANPEEGGAADGNWFFSFFALPRFVKAGPVPGW